MQQQAAAAALPKGFPGEILTPGPGRGLIPGQLMQSYQVTPLPSDCSSPSCCGEHDITVQLQAWEKSSIMPHMDRQWSKAGSSGPVETLILAGGCSPLGRTARGGSSQYQALIQHVGMASIIKWCPAMDAGSFNLCPQPQLSPPHLWPEPTACTHAPKAQL